MNGSGDDIRRLAADVELYLRQQAGRGRDWVIDEGRLPVAAAGIPATANAAAPSSDPVAGAAPAAAAAPAPEPVAESAPVAPPAADHGTERAAEAKAAREEAFGRECDRFVAGAMEQIARFRPIEKESDLFSAPEAAPVPMDRAEKARRLEALAAEVAVCEGCKLHETRRKTVSGEGDPDADLVFVGEAPGRDEDLQGVPFVGKAGHLLDDILKAIHLTRDEIYICNILKCRPPNNRDPEADEVAACSPFLARQFEILQPKLICCLGRHAAMTLLDTRASLRSMRESLHFHQGVPVMATFHPAALLRNQQWKRPVWDDVRKLRALYDALRAENNPCAG